MGTQQIQKLKILMLTLESKNFIWKAAQNLYECSSNSKKAAQKIIMPSNSAHFYNVKIFMQ